MKILTFNGLFLLCWVLMSCSAGSDQSPTATTSEGSKGAQTSSVTDDTQQAAQGMDQLGTAGMRAEEEDGTMLPPAVPTTEASSMSTEGLQEVQSEGGGTQVNLDGRFQSILKVPEGSNEAIHVDTHDEQKH